MNFILSLREITEEDRRQVGGKGLLPGRHGAGGNECP